MKASVALLGVALLPNPSSAQNAPNMPTKNSWLADGPYPISHTNAAATEAVAHMGPTVGRKLTVADVKTIANVFTSNPTVKNVNGQRIIIASGVDGVRKILATNEAFELVSFLPYPGLEALAEKVTPAALQAALDETNAAMRAKDDVKLLALTKPMAELGFSRAQIPNGTYNFIDKDGFHYAPFGGLKILKSTDGNDPQGKLRVEKVKDLAADVPAELKQSVTHILGMAISYQGDVMVAAGGILFLLDRDLSLKGTLPLPGELIENDICSDEQGTYVVTSKRMLKVVWTGSKLSIDEADGGWQSEYNTMTREQATAAGALTVSGGSGTTPTLMGFGDDPDKLVVISDGDPGGAQVVAFWRDKIPDGFKQKPGTKSARIADQIRTDISKVTIEPSAAVLGYGVVVLNGSYPNPVPDIWGNAFTSGVTRPAPVGVQKVNNEVDNTDVMVPVVSAASNMIYLANKKSGIYEYVGIDWNTGEIKARWEFPDDSRQWNAYGGITALLEDGDLLIGGTFAIKRLNIGGGK